MGADGHLVLRAIRLRAGEEWPVRGEGIYLVFPQGGSGRFQSRTLEQHVAPGDLVLVGGGDGGKFFASAKGDLVLRTFSLCFEHLFPLFANEEIGNVQNVEETFREARYYPASSAMAGECGRLLGAVPPHFSLDHRIQLLRVFGAILDVELRTVRRKRDGFVRADEHLIRVFEQLSSQEMLTLSVGELADRFGCSRRHLNRLFHQYFGVSVAALRMEMRLLKAASLLRAPGVKVINVAEQCGFNHLGLFNSCFKRRFGTSPGMWRRAPVPGKETEKSAGRTNSECMMQINGLCPWAGSRHGTQSLPQSPVNEAGASTGTGAEGKAPDGAGLKLAGLNGGLLGEKTELPRTLPT